MVKIGHKISIDKAKLAQVPNNEIRTRNKTRKGEERSAVMWLCWEECAALRHRRLSNWKLTNFHPKICGDPQLNVTMIFFWNKIVIYP